jgi:hypothetical protein
MGSIVLEQGRLLIHKETRLVYTVHRVLPGGNVILECDDDGSLQNDDNPTGDGSPEEVLQRLGDLAARDGHPRSNRQERVRPWDSRAWLLRRPAR